MKTNETSRILDAVAADFISADLNLLPQIAARFERKTFMQTLRARPALLILLVLLALGLLTGVAYAIGRSLGYIPGVGIVEQGATIRVLVEPVALTRDGITLTVTQATLTTEKTVLVYRIEGVPAEARPKGESAASCNPSTPSLQLSDGTELKITGGEGNQSESRMTLPPVPDGMYAAKFFLPCLMDVAPGKAPENWGLPLRFMPAPPDLTVVPVIELATPVPATPTSVPVTKLTSDPFLGITFNLDSLTRTDRGYILITSIQWDDKTFASVGTNQLKSISLVDASGKKINILPLTDTYPTSSIPNRTVIGFSLADEAFTPPLTLNLAWAGINLTDMPRFTFDPGTDPQVGQTWPVNQKIEVAGFPLQIENASFMPSAELNKQEWMRFNPEDMVGFDFSIAADPAIQSLYLAVKSGFSTDGTGTSGYSGLDTKGKLTSVALLNGKIIAPLTIEAGYLEVRHPWQITFNPAEIMTSAAAPASAGFDASLQIEKVIPLADGYYLIGRTNWNDPRFTDLALGGWDAKLRDASGAEIPLEPANMDEIGISNFQPNEWAYRVYGKALPATLTLSLNQASVQFSQPYTFSFDAGQTPQVGQEWQINQPLDILGHQATVQKAKFVTQGDLRGFEFDILTDEQLSLSLNIEGGVNNGNSSGGGSAPRSENGVLKAYTLTGGQFNGQPVLIAIRSAALSGNWQVTWNPPAAEAGATPFVSPTACVTLETWKQALKNPPAIPPGLPQSVLLSRGALAPDPSLFLANLDGSHQQGLVFGNGSLSPDGLKLVYSDENGRLLILEIASGKKQQLTNGTDYDPFWSPDGNQIAFRHQTEKGLNVFIMDTRGKNLRALTDVTTNPELRGWSPDGGHLILVSSIGKKSQVELLDPGTGQSRLLFSTSQPYNTSVSISPDGNLIAYTDKVVGKMAPGIYVSHLDGSEKRLLVQLDDRQVIDPLWSPDGKWLAFSVLQNDFLHPGMVPTLVNLESCQVVPLPGLNEEIRFWVNP